MTHFLKSTFVRNYLKKVKPYLTHSYLIHASNPPYHTFYTKLLNLFKKLSYQFVRQVVDEGGVTLEMVHAKVNSIDMFTKPVLLEKLWWCIASLGLLKRW
jgi:hypothetical protein